MVIFSLRVTYPDPLFEGRLPEAFCRRGTGAAPASEGLNATFVPGPYSGSLAGHYEPARSDHGQRHKGQDAALARRKARVHESAPTVRRKPDNPPGVIRALRLVGAPSPSIFEGDGREEVTATPWPRAANRGRFSFASLQLTSSQRAVRQLNIWTRAEQHTPFVPAEARTQTWRRWSAWPWVPASAGTNGECGVFWQNKKPSSSVLAKRNQVRANSCRAKCSPPS